MATSFFLKQKMMRKMLIALAPIYAFSFYLYGVRLLWLSLFVFTGGILTEWLMERRMKKGVSEAVLVTCTLFTLSLPPYAPWWVALIGIAFGVFFAKEVYGGFGRNIFNPAIVSRLFVYISFPAIMTAGWVTPGSFGMNPITTSTPLSALREGAVVDVSALFWGVRAGSLGESPIVLILIAAIFLMFTKTASWKIMLSTFFSGAIFTLLLDVLKVPGSLPFFPAILSGSFLFVTVFMATDPVSAPKKSASLWIYGCIIGVVAILIRSFSLFPEGMSFAVIMGNIFASLLDYLLKKKKEAPV